ncbi:hypothetical protein ALC62_00066 [Cyphomyrmex costatus]|nr:hypothetical protein ALC62_00066 [Cyphomyrmex costatus]
MLPYDSALREFVTVQSNISNIDTIWCEVRDLKTSSNEQSYKEIGQFALDVLVLPHSSADCERIFSKINHIKTSSRNKFLSNTVQGLLAAAECISDVGCINFQPSDKMLSYMTADNIYGAKKTDINDSKKNLDKENEIFEEECDIIFD